MKSLFLAAVLACGFAIAGAGGAHAMPAATVMKAAGPAAGTMPVDYYWHHRHWHHRRWFHHHWHYYD